MTDTCELCRHDALEPIYEPEGTARGLKIHLCRHCGLVQSTPRADRAKRAPAAISAAADWGNVRYGKGFRTKAALTALNRHADFTDELSLLDVGSNRGSFARAFLEAAPNAQLTAVEPDERVADAVRGLKRTELVVARIEDAALETNRFDIVHSCHTLEHVAEPMRVLADHWRVLKPGGLLLIDVPNIVLIGVDDIVEEWFIDKHLTHFSTRTLMRMVAASGFEIVEPPDANDRENLLIVARKAHAATPAREADAREVAEAEALLAAYMSTRARNLAALTAVAAEIATYAPRRVAIWGAGRLFDVLVTHGHFNPGALSLLVDKHLTAHAATRHGRTLFEPEALKDVDPGVIVVMSRGFAGEIAAEARVLAPKAEIVLYTDLMAQARLERAA